MGGNIGKPLPFLMAGLDSGGKTTILYKLRLGTTVTTVPTPHFNEEEIVHKGAKFLLRDVGGGEANRGLWRELAGGCFGVVWVVDSNDRDRMEESKAELERLRSDLGLGNAPLLVWANKQDLPNALSVAAITEMLGLHTLRDCHWYIQGCCAPTADGLWEGLDWLRAYISKTKDLQPLSSSQGDVLTKAAAHY